jgi:3-deoxy-7-phosphoheptulonate synthase
MVESHLIAGAQKFSAGIDDPSKLEYGKSITDACIGWEHSLEVLEVLSDAVITRRSCVTT